MSADLGFRGREVVVIKHQVSTYLESAGHVGSEEHFGFVRKM
jgi:hypothetical protein